MTISEYNILLKADGNEYSLKVKEGCKAHDISLYVSNTLLKYTCNNLEMNGKLLQPQDVLSIENTLEIDILHKKYSESDARYHLEKVANAVQQDSLLTSVLEKECELKLLDVPISNYLRKSSIDFEFDTRQKSLRDVCKGHLFYFKFRAYEIIATVDGFCIGNDVYMDMVELLQVKFDIKEFVPYQPISSFCHNSFAFTLEYPGQASRKFTSLTNTFQIEIFGDLNNEIQSLKAMANSTDNNDSLVECDKSIHLLEERFKELACDGVIGVVQGGIEPVNPLEPESMHIFVWNNLFIGKVGDWYEKYTDSKYNRELANAAGANKEMECQIEFNKINSSLCTMMTCLVDFAGQRYIVQPILGNSFKSMLESPIIFGQTDKKEYRESDSIDIDTLSDQLGLDMNNNVSITSCFHEFARITEFHDTKYISDFVRLTPLDSFAFEQFKTKQVEPIHDIMYYRQELVSSLKSLRQIKKMSINDYSEELCIYLRDIAIPMFVFQSILNPVSVSHSAFIALLHDYGINIRHLNVVATRLLELKQGHLQENLMTLYVDMLKADKELFKSEQPEELPNFPSSSFLMDKIDFILTMCHNEIICRTYKSLFMSYTASITDLSQCTSQMLQLINEPPSKEFYDLMNRKFLCHLEFSLDMATLKRICDLVGLKLTLNCIARLNSDKIFQLSIDDIDCWYPLIKQSHHTSDLPQLMQKDSEFGRNYLFSVYGSTSAIGLDFRLKTVSQVLKLPDISYEDLMQEMMTISVYIEATFGCFSREFMSAVVFHYSCSLYC